MLHDFWRLLTPYWTSSRKRTAWGLVLLLVFLDLFSIFMAKKLNDWHGQFFAALQAVDQTRFVSLLLRWAVIMSIMVVAAAYKTYANQVLQISWRSFLTERMTEQWLAYTNYYRLELAGTPVDNPDQRIQSDIDVFTAGVGPGILMLVVFSIYGLWFNRHMPSRPFDVEEFSVACREGVWAAMLPVILLGGIYSGYFTATEAAAVALVYACFVEMFIHHELKPSDFYNVVLEQSKLGGSLFPVLAVALSLNIVLIEHRIPGQMVELMQSYISSPLMFMLLVNLLLLLVGCLMTTNEAILILAPLLAPVAEAYGISKVAFGIVMILNLEIGFLTPPVGLNLIVAMSAFKQPFGLLVKAAVPFIVILVACLAMVIRQPWIAMALVNMKR